jgi:aspartate/tyrosine/aromatic aminotransferase
MLENLAPQPADALLALIKLHNADPRDTKIDLGVGVYRTADGATPVFKAIKAAEAKLLADQDSKAYLGPEGDMGFVNALIPMCSAPISIPPRWMACRRRAAPARCAWRSKWPSAPA